MRFSQLLFWRRWRNQRQQADTRQTNRAFSEAQFQQLVAHIPGIIYTIVHMTDGTTRLEYISPAVQDILEVTPGEALADFSRVFRLWHPEDVEGYNAALRQSLKNLEPFSYEWRVITPSGQVKWLRAERSFMEQRPNGDIVGYGIVLDVSGRKAADLSLQRYERIVSATTDAISLVDRHYHYRIVNQTYLDWNQKQYNQIVGHSVADLMGQEVFEAVVKPQLDRCLAGEMVQYSEWFEFAGLGRQFVSVTYSPYLEADQTISGVVVSVRNITPLKQAEEALQQGEERFREIAQTISQLFFVRSAKTGKYMYVSPAYEQIWGRPCESLYADPQSWLASVHPEDRPLVAQTLADQFEGNSVNREYRIIRPNGEICWISAQITVIRDAMGQPERFIGFAADISDRKRVEEALQQSEQLFRGAFETSAFGISIRSPEGPYLKVNPALCQILGYTEAEFLALSYRDITHPDDWAIAPDKTINRLVAGEISYYHLEKRFIHKQGHIVWALVSISLVRDLQQQPLYFVAQVQDITKRKQAEEALRESEERFRNAFQDAPIGMALISLDESWLKVNPMLCNILGYAEYELLFMDLWTIIYPEDVNVVQRYFEQVQNNEVHEGQIKLRYCYKDGRIAWGLLSLSLVRNAEEQPFYYVAQIQDITEQYAVDRMKNEFISIVSHELRTPLTAIRGFLGLLDTGIYDDKPERAKRMLSQAIANTERLVRLVNDILDLERLSSGKVDLIMEFCDSGDLMHRAIAEIQPIADKATVNLILLPISSPIWAAPDAIIQTLTNLLSNAIKFSPPNARVILAAEVQSDTVLFSVKDQGRGIPPDKLESIFGRFQQVDVSDSRQKGGTGLGLAICQNIVQQHGGSIWTESRLGEGSIFYFTVPRYEQANSGDR